MMFNTITIVLFAALATVLVEVSPHKSDVLNTTAVLVDTSPGETLVEAYDENAPSEDMEIDAEDANINYRSGRARSSAARAGHKGGAAVPNSSGSNSLGYNSQGSNSLGSNSSGGAPKLKPHSQTVYRPPSMVSQHTEAITNHVPRQILVPSKYEEFFRQLPPTPKFEVNKPAIRPSEISTNYEEYFKQRYPSPPKTPLNVPNKKIDNPPKNKQQQKSRIVLSGIKRKGNKKNKKNKKESKTQSNIKDKKKNKGLELSVKDALPDMSIVEGSHNEDKRTT